MGRCPAAPSHLHPARVPVLICSARLCGVEGGWRFSIISAVFGCEVEMDAWVGVCWWGAPAETDNAQQLHGGVVY